MNYKLPLTYLQKHAAERGDQPYLHQPVDRQFTTYTFAQVSDMASRIAAGLLAQGYGKGDRVAILAKNSAEWFIVDFAIQMAGLISVPIYFTAGEDTIRYVLEHSESKAVFVGKLDDPSIADRAIEANIDRIAFPYDTAPAKHQWADWLATYQPLSEWHMADMHDIYTIVYTSGSTGVPKGVVTTFLNISSSAESALRLVEGDPSKERMMSYLPLAHITERAVVLNPSLLGGGQVFFVESLDTFADDLKYAKPTMFVSVPRLWSKFQSQILAKMPDEKLQKLLSIPLLGKFVAYNIRKAMGLHCVTGFGSGTAPIAPAVLHWFARLGIQIREGWGMTETSGLSCGNLPYSEAGVGTIGRPVDCVTMKLSDQGEIMISGEAVFKQYYKAPELTEQCFTDGWFHTGDLGEVTAEGNYRIIGRIKEQFKTGKGKYCSPVPIESLLGANPLVEQVAVMGAGRKQPVAVAILADTVQAGDPKVTADLTDLLNSVNAKLEGHEKLDAIIVGSDPWTIENELLTPTMKLKRDRIEASYEQLVQSLPSGHPVLWQYQMASDVEPA